MAAIRRYVFSEMPYAFAIGAKWIPSRCTFCLLDLEDAVKCGGDCGTFRYCSQRCRMEDEQLHQYECMAVSRRNAEGKDKKSTAHLLHFTTIRLLGRMIGRKWIDGGKVVLSEDFPNDLAQDRCLDDLMTHKRHILLRPGTFRKAKEMYFKFFRATPLASVKMGELFDAFCRYSINAFGVAGYDYAYLGAFDQLGTAVYLNASRFNHSCHPTGVYTFEGARLVIDYLDQPKGSEIGNGNAPPADARQLTKEQLESLTLNYGFGSVRTYGCVVPLAKQRKRSLMERYFFHCQCEWCSDKVLDELQRGAAPVQCSQCSLPYVWRPTILRNAVKLRKSCRCADKKEWREKEFETAPWLLKKDAPKRAMALLREWKSVMMRRRSDGKCLSADAVQSALIAALQYWHQLEQEQNFCSLFRNNSHIDWHPTHNLRLGHLAEELLTIAWHRITSHKEAGVSQADLDSAVFSGEAMMNVYTAYCGTYHLTVAAYAARLCMLHKIQSKTAGDEHCRLAEAWFETAMRMWTERFGEIDSDQCLEAITAYYAPLKAAANGEIEEADHSDDEEGLKQNDG